MSTAMFTRLAVGLLCRVIRRRDKHRPLIAWRARSKERRQQAATLDDLRSTRIATANGNVYRRRATRSDARPRGPGTKRKDKTRQQRQSHQENESQEERNLRGSRGYHHEDGVLDDGRVTTGDRSRDSVGFGNGIRRSRWIEESKTQWRKVHHTNDC